ncbi:MAG: hypothetical protein IVW55_16865 [Chloroflexi bacterium]|nr:hypothetical protein [Chloroflexota bacterium]
MKSKKVNPKLRWLSISALVVLALPAFAPNHAYAQGSSRTFPETGKTVTGRFLDYWNTHGGLAQQGYPISESMQETSDTDGKSYTVQYFERAEFEAHPENPAPYDVLLSLLGNFLYKQKYPNGAPGQVANTSANSRLFPETQRRVGGIFLDYWNTHGGLAQQGLPLSDEFQEVSDLNGQTYKVQYFERAVFEYHPENQAPYDVLLSQLGKFRYSAKYVGGPNPNPPPNPNPQPTPKPTTAPPPPPPAAGCNLPNNKNAVTDKRSIQAGQSIRIAAGGFTPGEPVSYWFTAPDGSVAGTAHPVDLGPDANGNIGPYTIQTDAEFAQFPGRWALTFQGAYSGNVAVAYFCITR